MEKKKKKNQTKQSTTDLGVAVGEGSQVMVVVD